MMARLIAAAALRFSAVTTSVLACEWNKSAGANSSTNRRLAIQRSAAEQASAATQALLAQHLDATLH